jgi:hypothetical protein
MSRFQTVYKQPLPAPSRFFLGMLATSGSSTREYPTFTLSYIGSREIPDHDMLGDIQAFSTTFEPKQGDKTTLLDMVAFLQPKKELLDFADSVYVSVPVPTLETNSMFRKIEEYGRYVVLINTEVFLYRALVDDDSGEVLEASIEYRYLS